MKRALVSVMGAAVVLLGGGARAADEVQLDEVVLDGDHAIVRGRVNVPGSNPGSFVLRVRKAEVREGELLLSGPLDVTFGRVTQTVQTASARLSDADGVCDAMAITMPDLHLAHFGLEVDSAAVDVTVQAATSGGRALANLVCGTTHILDEPGPLVQSAPVLADLVNKALPKAQRAHGRPGRAATTAQGDRGWANPAAQAPQDPAAVDGQAPATYQPGQPVQQQPASPRHRSPRRRGAQQVQPAQQPYYPDGQSMPSATAAPAPADLRTDPARPQEAAWPDTTQQWEGVRPAQRPLRPRTVDADDDTDE